MNGKTHAWFFSTFLFVPLLYADSQYECGAHGRFEYCIDGIPGCVIGCHCHPGYYFDTDTKICEPNIKLTQEFRRNYLSEPTRVKIASITRPPEEQPSTPSAIDEKIDEIAKDADDLGDWLYNQFFKTIENQVINKTQGEEIPTRRSGNVLLKPERRSHKYWRGKKKKKKKSKGLKSKLLRITEDDSLFDSDSRSSMEEDGSSSSESDTSRSTGDKDKKKDGDHDHKKIIIFNKKPQPPLPSFIFLPNMETPFYPPIGLPPPPAMPMYPMVPVPPMLPGPPMGGPLFPYPGVPHNCEDETTTSESTLTITTTESTTTTTDSTTTTTDSTTSSTTTSTDSTTTSTDSTTMSTDSTTSLTTTQKSDLRYRHRKRKNKPFGISNNDQGIQNNMMRNKLFKKLREKLNRKNKLENYFVDQYQDSDLPMEVNDPSASLPIHDIMNLSMNVLPPQQDVDFKYLAELIHKADLNKTLNNQLNLNNNNPENIITPSRRYNDQINNKPAISMVRQTSRMEDNDSFYTNLGKQIATMIRKIDSKGEREVNIEIEGADTKPQAHTSPVFNENNYAARSYWERSVRSPLTYLGSFRKEMDHLKKSNEDLFSLENQVALAASTTRTLSLHDLENIISTVEKVRVKPKRNNVYNKKYDHSNASFKLNLLPGNVETIQPVKNIKPVQSFPNNTNTINKQNTRRKQTDTSIVNSFLLSNFRHLSPDYEDLITKSEAGKKSLRTVTPTRKPTIKNSLPGLPPPRHLITSFMPSLSIKEPTSQAKVKYHLSPISNQNNLNYYTFHNNPYLFEKASPLQFTGLTKSLRPYGKVEKPSYFHHEFHHFDYFDM